MKPNPSNIPLLEPARTEISSSVDRTFVINFRVVPTKVKYSDISDFITSKLGFDISHIKHLQISNGRVFVGTDSVQLAQEMVHDHNLKHQVEYGGKQYEIPLSMEDGSVEVRIHDLRPRVTNRQVAQRMLEYGEVLSIRDETWKDFFPGVPNGIRVLRMKLRKPIPSYVTVDSEMSLVTYKGQAATCKHCQRNVHYTQSCSEYAKSLSVSVNERLTMAEALKGIRNISSNQMDGDISPMASTSNIADLTKDAPTHTSNASLASEISLSSTEQMEQDFPQLPGVEKDVAVEASNAFADENENDRQAKSHGPSDRLNTRSKQQKTIPNVKRPGSPLVDDNKNTEKRQSRSEVRLDRIDTRAYSKSRKH